MPKPKWKLNTIYISERLQESLRPISRCALTTVVAPMGYGKTTAVNWYLEERAKAGPLRVVRISVYSDNLAIFWRSAQDAFARAGIDLLPSRDLRLQIGDKLTIVGEQKAIDRVAEVLGNQEKELRNPNLLFIFIGLMRGLILGSLPISIPGMSVPIRLGIAGGPILIGILMGAFGPRIHLTTYTTHSANLMLRQFGLTIYLAGLGLSAGPDFFETVLRPEGLLWIGISVLLAIVPVLLVGFVAAKFCKTDYSENVGMLCASMANPIALNYALTTVDDDEPSVAYATVYPMEMFLRVISGQVLMLL